MNYLNYPVFIIGHPKSGTTLLTTMLDSHPELMVFPEESIFYSAIEPTTRALNLKKNFNTDDKIKALSGKIFGHSYARNFFKGKVDNHLGGNFDYSGFQTEKFKNLILDNISWNRIDAKALFLSIIHAYASVVYSDDQIHSFKYWVEKTPIHIYYLKKIKNDFPNAKFIFIYRDPRDNFVSYTKREGSHLNAISFSYSWNKCFEIAENVVHNEILFIKYEELLTSPDKQIDAITDFLGVEKSSTLYQPTKMGIQWKGNSMFGEEKNGIDPSGLYRYKTLIKKKDHQTIEVLCKSNMLKYNYPLDLERQLMPAIKAIYKTFIYKTDLFFTRLSNGVMNNIRLIRTYISGR